MKKLISLLLALVMVFSLAMSVAAVDEDPSEPDDALVTRPGGGGDESFTIKVTYKKVGTTAEAPGVTFGFEVASSSMKDNGVNVTTVPALTITGDNNVTITNTDMGTTATATKDFTVTLPTYPDVGVFTYILNPTVSAENLAGVVYFADPVKVVVTVQRDANGLIYIAGVHTEKNFAGTPGNGKSDGTENTYTAGSLKVTKEVTGNLGDTSKPFDVDVTFYAPEIKNEAGAVTGHKTVKSTIKYLPIGAQQEQTITFPDGATSVTKTITLKSTDTVNFKNLPDGVTYKVHEHDYTGAANGEYDAPKYDYEGTSKQFALTDAYANRYIEGKINGSEEDIVKITNNKGVPVDTGIILDSAPYVLLLAVAVIGLAVVIIKKRQAREY